MPGPVVALRLMAQPPTANGCDTVEWFVGTSSAMSVGSVWTSTCPHELTGNTVQETLPAAAIIVLVPNARAVATPDCEMVADSGWLPAWPLNHRNDSWKPSTVSTAVPAADRPPIAHSDGPVGSSDDTNG